MAAFYKTVIIPARPRRPKDKAKAENAVLIVQRWILATLRHQTFFTLTDLNVAINALLEDLNRRPFKKLPGCRLSQFELIDKPVLSPLPIERYEYIEFKMARVNIDYHVEFEKNYYSVPHKLVKEEVEVQASKESIAVFFKGEVVAKHVRHYRAGSNATDVNHMPKSHQYQQQWSCEKLISWGEKIGTSTQQLIQHRLKQKQHPEQSYRACLGLLALSKQYSAMRLEAACKRALHINAPRLTNVKSILESNMDQLDLPGEPSSSELGSHSNVRGSDYYH